MNRNETKRTKQNETKRNKRNEKNKACGKRRLYTNPVKPGASTNENPVNAHLTKLLDINGFLAILFSSIASIKPTPTPAPANTINGILGARCLKPSNIIKDSIRSFYFMF